MIHQAGEPQAVRKVRILSIDGGGVRGLSALIIIKALMLRVAREADPLTSKPAKPCDYFDFIIGTSTGGLIALILGRLRMDVDACIRAYTMLARQVFKPKTWGAVSRASGRGLYKATTLKAAVCSIVSEAIPQSPGDTPLLDPRYDECRVAVVAARELAIDASPTLFRSYPGVGLGNTDGCAIWQAARATTAASTFFKPIIINDVTYLDGAIATFSNPAELAVEEVRRIWPGCEIALLLSIGTGAQVPIDVNSALQSFCFFY